MNGFTIITSIKTCFVSSLLVFLVGCSNSSGGSSSEKPGSEPVANAGSDQVNVPKRSLVQLDGSLSSDPDGASSLTYMWVQKEGTEVELSGDGSMPTFIAPAVAQKLVFELNVTDPEGLSSLSGDNVNIIVTNQIPVADAGPNQTVTYDPQTSTNVILDGNASSDHDNDSLSFSWVYTGCTGVCREYDRRSGNTFPLSIVLSDPLSPEPGFTVPVTYGVDLQFLLKVTDEDGMTAEAVTMVRIRSRKPVAQAGQDNIAVRPGDAITLDGTGSFDPESGNLNFRWSQINGTQVEITNATSSIASFIYPVNAADRSLEFQLVVNDGESDSTPDSIVVTAIDYDGENINYPENPFLSSSGIAPQPAMGVYDALTVQHNMAISGTDVYIPHRGGLTIVDASNPLSPRLRSEVTSIGESTDLQIIGTEAFVFKGIGSSPIQLGLEIINIGNPALPVITGSALLTTPTYGIGGTPPLNIVVRGNTAFMVDYYTGLTTVDISNRTLPGVISETTSGAISGWPYDAKLTSTDLYIASTFGLEVIDVSNTSLLTNPVDTNIEINVNNINFANDLLYVSGSKRDGNSYDGGLEIYKPVDRINFRKLSSVVTSGAAERFTITGNTLYLADGHPARAGRFSGINIYDISDSSVPDLIGNYRLPSVLSDPAAIEVNNNIAYVLNSFWRLVIIPGLKVTLEPDYTAPVVAGTSVSYSFSWIDPGTSVALECRVSGGTCTIENTATGIANVSWNLPALAGRYKISATVGNQHFFLSATDIVSLQ